MNLYLLTLTFLTLMSLVTASEVVHFVGDQSAQRFYRHYRDERLSVEQTTTEAALADFRASSIPKTGGDEKPDPTPPAPRRKEDPPPDPLHVHRLRPPNNARLNVYALLQEERDPRNRCSLYEVAARLLRSLYGKTDFFHVIPSAEYCLLDRLLELKEETLTFSYPDELGTLELGDPTLQTLWCALLKGSEASPSLLNYLTFDRGRQGNKINLLFAPRCLVEAFFETTSLSSKVLTLRDELVEAIFYQEAHRKEMTKAEGKNRTRFKQELQQGVEQLLLEEGLSSLPYRQGLDFSLGKMGTILFIEDPHTGYVHREKYVSPIRTA